MTLVARSALMTVMTRAVEKAGKALVRDFGEVENLQVSRKGPSDFVSQADIKAEKILVESLSKDRPTYGFLLEEGGEQPGKDPDNRFIIDPLDGTANFLHGIPQWAVSVACEQKGEIVAGVVFNPITDEMFWAEKGAGAYCNAQRLRVSARRVLEDSMVATGLPCKGRGDHPLYLKELSHMMDNVAGMRRMGSAALDLSYVAAGRFEAYWERGIYAWDIAAGALIVREAGGKVTGIDGSDKYLYDRNILASNMHVHDDIKKALQAGRNA